MKYKLSPPQAIHELGQRANQEDSLYPAADRLTADDRLFIVCDGMGGHDCGEVASQLVCNALSEFVNTHTHADQPFSETMFRKALAYAYQKLDATPDDPTQKQMGTTLTLLRLHRGGCLAAHIGDSRIYQIRPSEHRIIYRSRDHSLVNDLFEAGEISEEELKTSPQKNVITRCMMAHQQPHSEATIVELTDIEPGDYFLLCTDGMLEKMSDEELTDIISDPEETDETKAIILKRETADNRDNHSALLVHIDELTVEKTDILKRSEKSEEASTRRQERGERSKIGFERRGENDESVQVVSHSQQPTTHSPQNHSLPKHSSQKARGKNLLIALITTVAVAAICLIFYFSSTRKQPDNLPKNDIEEFSKPDMLKKTKAKTKKSSTKSDKKRHKKANTADEPEPMTTDEPIDFEPTTMSEQD